LRTLSSVASVLAVVADPSLQLRLAEHLRLGGHVVETADTGDDALVLARERHVDLVLVDGALRAPRAIDVCAAIKGDPRVRAAAVVLLCEPGEDLDRVVGLELGADDCVSKPISMRELVLRVRAILRRRTRRPSEAHETTGLLSFDRLAHRVWVDRVDERIDERGVSREEVTLTVSEFRLLLRLFDARPQVLTRESLLRDLWQVDEPTPTRALDTMVKRLRRKLGPAGVCIRTVRSIGYRLLGPDEIPPSA
jgi:two-component system phosphate regulon response regulator PhoB